jgi:hypothetical protein
MLYRSLLMIVLAVALLTFPGSLVQSVAAAPSTGAFSTSVMQISTAPPHYSDGLTQHVQGANETRGKFSLDDWLIRVANPSANVAPRSQPQACLRYRSQTFEGSCRPNLDTTRCLVACIHEASDEDRRRYNIMGSCSPGLACFCFHCPK